MPAFPRAEVDRLPYAGEAAADRLLVEDPMALLVGFILDQQVPLERAFSAPLELRRRLGTISPSELLALDSERVERAFARSPALHRFPRMMAGRVLALCRLLEERYQGRPQLIWEEAADAVDLKARLRSLPGVGSQKAETILGVLARQLGVRPAGWEALMPDHPCLADVRDDAGLAAYRAYKRSVKARS
ncbi:MAG: HhH-GPD-type base excision DNA repair protein [Candidatus Dormibacteria bacterium]